MRLFIEDPCLLVCYALSKDPPFSHFSCFPAVLASLSYVIRFDITPNGQQIHIAFGTNDIKSRRHPCFKLDSPESLLNLRDKIYAHFLKGGSGAPEEADKPGEKDSGKSH